MKEVDSRWQQRFDNYSRALQVLERGVALAGQRQLSELEQQGLIQVSNSPTSWPGSCSRTICNIRASKRSPVPVMPRALPTRTV
jgi:hypothetical protein